MPGGAQRFDSSAFYLFESFFSVLASSTLYFQSFKNHPSHSTRVNSSLNIAYRNSLLLPILPLSVLQPVVALSLFNWSQCWQYVALRAVAAFWVCKPSASLLSQQLLSTTRPESTGRSRLAFEERSQAHKYTSSVAAAEGGSDSSEIRNACVHMNNHEMWQAGQHLSKSISGKEI